MPATLEPPVKPAAPAVEPAKETAPLEVGASVKEAFLNVLAGKLEPMHKPVVKTDEPAKPDKEPEAAAAEPEPKPKVRRKQHSEQDTVEIAARAAATATAEVMARQPQRPEPVKQDAPKPIAEQIPAQHRKKLEVFQEMAAAAPERYETLVTDFVDAVGRLEVYKKTWITDNPGSKFDPDAQEHNEFFERNEPDYDEEDYDAAHVNLRLKPIEAKANRVDELEKELKEIKAADEARRMEPAVESIRIEAAKAVMEDIDPEMGKAINNPEEFDKLVKAADPLAVEISIAAAKHAGQLVAEAVRVFDGQGKIQIDWNAPATRAFLETKNELEVEIKGLPVDDQVDAQGRRFATWTEYDAIVKHRPEAAAKYWVLDRDILRIAIPKKIASKARDFIKKETERFESTAKARGFTKPNAPNGAHSATPNKSTDAAKVPTATAFASPAAAGGKTSVDTLAKPGPNTASGWQDNFLSVMGGKLS